ncbi:hypothetical protein CLOP_g11063, partial [Closterium sp. NIES-67]
LPEQEAEVISLLRPERSQHDELVQASEISDENLDLLLDRADMLDDAPAAAAALASGEGSSGGGGKAQGGVRSLPPAGPGWEVVVVGASQSSVLSSIG